MVGTFVDEAGVEVSYRRWLPEGPARSVVVVAHGASEHSGRYERFATALAADGHAVYAPDHRGHGLTAKATGVGLAGPGGWEAIVDDLRQLVDLAVGEQGSLPVVLFGHSMGSFLAQGFVQRHGARLAGLVLSGSAGGMGDVAATAEALATLPPDEASTLLGSLNGPFEPARTPFDWLSRDPEEVDRYVADPMCGDDAPLTNGFVTDMFRGVAATWEPENERRLPSGLEVLLITGEADPVSDGGATVRQLEERYRGYGADVTGRYYPEARHELLNETNRDDVQRDVLAWLGDVVAKAG